MKTLLTIFLIALSYIGRTPVVKSDIVYEGPIYINTPGTYSGNYKSDDPTQPAVRVFCYGLVTITNCNILSQGEGIQAYGGSKMVITYNNIIGKTPSNGDQRGRALNDYQPQTLVFEHNYVEGTGGLMIDHSNENTDSVSIRFNLIRNTSKQKVDGSEGGHRAAVLFNTVDNAQGLKGEVAWNQFENILDSSWIEDNINCGNLVATQGRPFLIHDNYIKGAYPPSSYGNSSYTGSGITVEGEPGHNTAATVSQWINIYNNQVISVCNGGININAGHDIHSYHNTIISSGKFPNGVQSYLFWGGRAIWNGSGVSYPSVFHDIDMTNDSVGYVRPGVNQPFTDRQDEVFVSGSPINVVSSASYHYPNPITLAMEEAQLPIFKAKVAAAGYTIGNVAAPPPSISYYVSAAGSNSNAGTSSSLPFLTPQAAINVAVAGDSILLRRGDTFGCDYYLAANNIHWATYSTGANPVFSGFVTVGSWVSEGSGMYSYTDATLPSFLNVVSFNGAFQPKRSNTAYLTFESHTGTGTGTITDNELSGSPSLVGGELVIRKRRWVTDRAAITAHSGGTLTYGALTGHATSYSYTPFDNYGYFIQNHTSVMTTVGDWKYDGSAKKITMYFGGNSPTSYVVKLSKAFRFAGLDGNGNTFNNIDFKGINQYGFSTTGNDLNLQSCNFSFIGETALYTTYHTGITVNNCTFTDMPNNGISGDAGCDNWTNTNNTFTRIGNWPGMGGSGDNKYIGSYVSGAGQLCQGNSFTDIGLYAIYFRGNGCIVRKNFVQNYCKVKDDGGGIYTYEGTVVSNATQRIVEDNIIINGVGVAAGTSDGGYLAHGIYVDEKSSQITVQRNTIVGCNHGIFLHNAANNSLKKNTIIGALHGIRYRTYDNSAPLTGLVSDSNIILSGSSQYISDFSSSQSTLTGKVTSTNNKYFSLNAAGNTFTTAVNSGGTDENPITFTAWKTATGTDASSSIATYTTYRIDYNNTASATTVSLGTSTYSDAYGAPFTGTQTIQPYSSRLFLNPVAIISGGMIIRKKVKIQ